MTKAKVHLTNGEVADITLFLEERDSWLRTVEKQGIHTIDSYFPYHSIVYILFEQPQQHTSSAINSNSEGFEAQDGEILEGVN